MKIATRKIIGILVAGLFVPSVICAVAQNVDPSDSKLRTPIVTVDHPIMPGIFHLVVSALPGSTMPPQSPFVLAPSELTRPFVRSRTDGTLTGDLKDVSNPLVLKSPSGKALLTLKNAVSDGISITLTFAHDPEDRFYGNGNESENHAGPLMHTSGKQVVNNGTTCVPFIWSPSGYGILIANNIQDMTGHIA